MFTFAQLKGHPELLTPDVRSPIMHADGTMTVLWEGDPGPGAPSCLAEWWEQPQPLEQISGTRIWGGDFPTPDLPRTVCASVGIGNERGPLLSPRHSRYLLGPDLPTPLTPEGKPSTRAVDTVLPARGLAGGERRVRIFLPPGYQDGQRYHTLYLTDGQMELDTEKRFPAIADTLRHQGAAPPLLLVVMDNGGTARPDEYLAGGSRNLAARRWVWETVVPYVEARYPAAQRWTVGGSNGASMALQLALGRPDLFSGGAYFSPWHRNGLDAVLSLADEWPGGGRFAISHGNFGLGERKNAPGAYALFERLGASGATVHFIEKDGYGHNFHAWQLAVPELLRWLFEEVIQ
ncbi:MAG TPA: alpha/beta hydrolase-fold protein [Ktedonobacterales bacterium]|nr:alpha/beta hydrolase-fold protein [Ktedonobacterales bacterium]